MVLMFADKDGTYSRVEVGTLKDSSGYLDFVYRLLYDGRTNHALPTNAMAFSNPYVRATLIRNEFYNNTCVLSILLMTRPERRTHILSSRWTRCTKAAP